jgi:hypothetical protein
MYRAPTGPRIWLPAHYSAKYIRHLIVGSVTVACCGFARGAEAQMPVPGLRGDFGLKAGTAPLPGIYLMDIFFWYSADKVVGANGRAFERGHLDLVGICLPSCIRRTRRSPVRITR